MSARTAVPWVVALLGIGLIWYTRRGPAEGVFPDVPSDVHVCKENLRAIYSGLRDFKAEKGAAPAQPGQAFFQELITSGVWEDNEENRAKLTCAGSGSYAGRDTAAHPLAKFPSGGAEIETLIACDNANGMNHEGAMNVLQSDGTVITYQLEDLIGKGAVPPETTNLSIGPDSLLEKLRVLRPN